MYSTGEAAKRRNSSYGAVLPVLFLEFLSIGIARSLLPGLLVDAFGSHAYTAVGTMETIKGLLAFVSSPVFGKLSDRIGRKYCLLATVIGTTLPVGLMSFTSNMVVYAVFLSLSGFFSATFTLTFAFISDCVDAKRRAPAYGLALATLGLSFTIGPTLGSYIAADFSSHLVFVLSLVLTAVNALYIILYLPETANIVDYDQQTTYKRLGVAMTFIPNSWNFSEIFHIFRADPFLADLGLVVFLYYTAVWAIVSTFMVFVVRHLHFSAVQLGWLMTAYGFATMFSEGILVRIVVPRIGEVNSMRLGLISFAAQCTVVAISGSALWIFISVFFSMGANLFYPAVSSLVSKVVGEDRQGEALGALNGIKALTEGFGPLVFGMLMALFEHSPQPGSPFILAALISLWAFLHCFELPLEAGMDMIKRYESNQHNEHHYDPSRRLLSREDSSLSVDESDDESDYSSRSTSVSPLLAGKNKGILRL